MAIVGRAKYTNARAREISSRRDAKGAPNIRSHFWRSLRVTSPRSFARARLCINFAHPTIAITKFGDYSQSTTSRAAKMSHLLPVCVCCCHKKYVAVDKKQKKQQRRRTNKQTYDNKDPSVNKKRKLWLQSLCAQLIS